VNQKAPVLQQFVESVFNHKDFNEATLHQAKRVIADTSGVAYGGSNTPAFEKAVQNNQKLYGDGPYKIPGTKITSSLKGAIFYNALAMSSTDFDEGHRKAVGHPASLVVPVALALGDDLNKTHDDILKSVIIGYETGTRFSYARNPLKITTYSSGRWGAIASAATAAYLLNLNLQQWIHALSLACILSPGMLDGATDVSTGSMAKEGVPWAAVAGAEAALLAQKGFVGPYLFVDEDNDNYDYNKLLHGLGKDWLINSNYFKPYACCRWLHTAIQISLNLKKENHLNLNDIKKVNIHIFERAIKLISSKYPENVIQAQFHLPYTIAAALHYNEVSPRVFSELNLVNKDLWQLIDLIQLLPDSNYNLEFPDVLPSKVQIIMKDGKSFEAEAKDAPWGANAQPTDEELFKKFENQVGPESADAWKSIFRP
jgi:2-methylcitrate dehydratase PrpD